MDLRCVTRNLARWASGQQWVDEVAAGGLADLILVQEAPAPSGLRTPAGYTTFPDDPSQLRDRGHCRSLTLVAERLVGQVDSASYVLPEVLADYVSELVVTLPGAEPLHVFNVHASPRPVDDPEVFLTWKRDAESRVYHSDVVSSVLAERAGTGVDVLAVGDFNEAWLWDERHRTSSSKEFFERLASHGFTDVTMKHWGAEVTTQVQHRYQVDRLFATEGVKLALSDPSQSIGPADGMSDHLPITFTLLR